MPDLAIVGGGPAGLLTARRCAEAGLEVVVLEEHAEIGAPTHCTGIVSLATAALAKIPDDIILGRLQLARLVSPGGAACEVRWAASGSEEILVVDRTSSTVAWPSGTAGRGRDPRRHAWTPSTCAPAT
jgi:flavin-dependent dehydrogenase